jgi:hypothetical protein
MSHWQLPRTVMGSVSTSYKKYSHEVDWQTVEYTPQAYLQSDLDMFHGNFSDGLVGVAPYMVSIDGGMLDSTVIVIFSQMFRL